MVWAPTLQSTLQSIKIYSLISRRIQIHFQPYHIKITVSQISFCSVLVPLGFTFVSPAVNEKPIKVYGIIKVNLFDFDQPFSTLLDWRYWNYFESKSWCPQGQYVDRQTDFALCKVKTRHLLRGWNNLQEKLPLGAEGFEGKMLWE